MIEPTEQSPTPAISNRGSWPLWGRVGFRFAFIYWVLYMLPSPGGTSVIDLFPWDTERVDGWFSWPAMTMARWIGTHLFHLQGLAATWHPTGSGDTALLYITSACFLVLALTGAAVWTAIDERGGRRREYHTAYAWLRLFLRFTLALALLNYGFIKVFPEQFRPPDLAALTRTYGDSSPMGLLWTFMGASVPYVIFSGTMEATAGILLLFRRTSTVGAMMGAGVLLNVVLLNFCYDVPVKLYSMHLLLMALFLLLPDAFALWQFLILRRPAVLTGVWVPRAKRPRLGAAAHVLQFLVVIAALYTTAWNSYRNQAQPVSKPSLYGIWAVDKIEGAFPQQWTQVILSGDGLGAVTYPDGSRHWIWVTYNDGVKSAVFSEQGKNSTLHWTKDSHGDVTLAGVWEGSPITLVMHPSGPKEPFLLEARGFHWVQEMAYNR